MVMIVRESIEFKRGQDTKKALELGLLANFWKNIRDIYIEAVLFSSPSNEIPFEIGHWEINEDRFQDLYWEKYGAGEGSDLIEKLKSFKKWILKEYKAERFLSDGRRIIVRPDEVYFEFYDYRGRRVDNEKTKYLLSKIFEE